MSTPPPSKPAARTTVPSGEMIAMFGYAFWVTRAFSPYEAFEQFCVAEGLKPQNRVFLKDELTTKNIGDFLDSLEHKFGNYVSPDTVIGEDLLEFFAWNRIPTATDAVACWELLTVRGLLDEGQYLLEQLATGYMFKPFVEATFTPEQYFQWLADVGAKDRETALNTRFEIAREMIGIMADRNIARVGWSIQGVGAGEGFPMYAYTIGLAGKTGYELVCVASIGFDNQMLVLNETAQLGVDQGLVLNQPFELKGVKVNGGQNLRAEVIDVTGPEALKHVLDKRSQTGKIYQVLLGDADNRVPSELTEPSAFIQPLLTSVARS